MTELLIKIATTLLATIKDVIPILVVILGFQLFVLREAIPNLKKVLTGFLYVLLGLAFFLVGLDDALFPLGKVMAQQLTDPKFLFGSLENVPPLIHWNDYMWIYLFAAAIGFSTTIAEPALLAVAIKAHNVSGGAISVWGLRIAVAIGAAIGIALGSFRIITGTPLHYYIIAAYIIVIIQTAMAPKMIIALAFDSGGVTTSTVTVPLVTALGLGLATTIPGRSALLDGFGMIALTCLFPIVTLMAYAQIGQWRAERAHRKALEET